MIVLGGSASNGIDQKLAKLLNAKNMGLVKTDFPDGEFKVRVPSEISGEDIIFVQSLCPPQEKHLLELLLAADCLKELGARSICAVVPYLSYMRQDRRFQDGENISIRTELKLMNTVGIDSLVTVHPHKVESLSLFNGKVGIIEPIDLMADAIKKSVPEPFILAPDAGSKGFAEVISAKIGCECGFLNKKRDYNTGEVRIVDGPDKGFGGKQVVIVDDMISSGGTIVNSSRFALSKGAKSVSVAAVHLLMVGGAEKKMKDAGVGMIMGTNTTPYHDNGPVIDISADIAEGIRKLL